jgi:hypothetical protein
MSVAGIKRELHKAIDEIDNEELLLSMLTILAQGNNPQKTYTLTDDQMQLLKEKVEEYLKGDSKAQTFEEFRLKMNKKYSL